MIVLTEFRISSMNGITSPICTYIPSRVTAALQMPSTKLIPFNQLNQTTSKQWPRLIGKNAPKRSTSHYYYSNNSNIINLHVNLAARSENDDQKHGLTQVGSIKNLRLIRGMTCFTMQSFYKPTTTTCFAELVFSVHSTAQGFIQA